MLPSLVFDLMCFMSKFMLPYWIVGQFSAVVLTFYGEKVTSIKCKSWAHCKVILDV